MKDIDRTLVLAVDPGYTTGTALGIDRGDGSFEFIAAIEVEWANRFDVLKPLFATHHLRLQAIVIERFMLFDNPQTIRNQIGSEFPSCRVIGNVEALADQYGIFDRIVYQEVWAKRQLSRIPIEYDRLGCSAHNADAYRHLWYYCRTRHATRSAGL